MIDQETMETELHDCYVDAFGEIVSTEFIRELYLQVPLDIKQLAVQWGWDDSDVRDKLYVWMKEEKT